MKKKSLFKIKFVSFFMSIIMVAGMIPVKALDTNNMKEEENNNDNGPVIMIGTRTLEEYNALVESGEIKNDEKMAKLNGGISLLSTGDAGGFMEYYPGVGAYSISIDGRVAYCLDSIKNTPFSTSYNRGGKISDNVVKAILYHGYPNNASGLMQKYGLSENEARYYTQVALWQYLSPEFAQKSRGAYFDELYAKGKNQDIGGERNWWVDPSSAVLKVNSDYQESSVIKTSGSEGTFTFPSTETIWSVDINGNKKNTFNIGESFKVRASLNLDKEVSFNIPGYVYVPTAEKWVPDASYYQNLVEPEFKNETKLVNRWFTIVPDKTNIIIEKVDEDNKPLSGVVFGLYTDEAATNEIGRGTSDSLGKITFNNISFGKTYYIKELSTLDGYQLDSTINKIIVQSSNPTLKVINNKAAGRIEVIKIQSGNEDIKIPNTEFVLLDSEGNEVEKLITDESGKAISKELPFGEYILKETKASPGYILNPIEVPVVINENDKTYSYTIDNELLKGSIEVLKIDGNTEEPMSNVNFNVYNSKDELIETITTDEKGIANTSKLLGGDYYIQESEAPEGYIQDTNKYPVKIAEDNKVYHVTVKNFQKSGAVEILKVDEETQRPLAGAKFKITCDSEINKGKTYEAISNEAGIAMVNNLTVGKYTVVEIESPTGYVLNSQEYKFEIKSDKQVEKITIANSKIQGILEFSKVDEESGDLLKGATIIIQGVDNSDFKEEFVTGEKITTMKLPFGRYEIKEVIAPNGYVLSKEIIPLNIEKDNEVYKVMLKNKKITGKFEVLKIDADTEKPLAGAEMELRGLDASNKNIVEKFTTTENTKVFENLPYGDYQLKELKAPKGYELSDEVYKFKIQNNGEVYKYAFANKKINGILEFIKTDYATGEILSGAIVEITGMDSWNEEIKIELTSTNQSTKVNLPYGKYQIKEIVAPNGYQLSTEVSTFEIKEDGKVVKSELKNKKIKGEIKILKTDVDTGKVLEGAKFEIVGLDEWNKDVKIEVISEKKPVIIEVPFGRYSVREILAPKGYLLNNEVKEVEIANLGQVIDVEIKNKIIEGDLEFKKTDLVTGEILKGATITIEGIDEWNKDIKIEFTSKDKEETFKLKYGKYKITETVAPKGYVLTQEVGEFEILESGEVIKAEIKNKQIEGELEFSKIDADTKELVEGAEIEIVRENGQIGSDEEVNEELSKSLKTEVKVNLVSGKKPTKVKLPYGLYRVTEIKAPNGYILNSEPKFFEINEDGAIVKVEMENTKIKGDLEIRKIDTETKEPLVGAEFEIVGKDKDNKHIKEKITISNNTEKNKIKLPYGEYEVIETKAPEGYVLSKETKTIFIKENGQQVVLEFENKKIVGKLEFFKINKGKDALEGAKMRIVGENFELEFVSSKEGNVIELPYGEYVLTEIEAPNGYRLSDEKVNVNINKDKQVVKINFKNDILMGQLKFNKVSKEDGKLLKGATIGIYDDKQELVQKVTTDENGVAVSEMLPIGKYYYKELKAPKGYKLDNTIRSIEIKNDKEIVEATIVNEIQKEIPYTGGRNVALFFGFAVAFVITGVGLIIFANRKNKGNIDKNRFRNR